MTDAELIGLAYFGGLALLTAFAAVMVQAVFFDISSRIGHLLLWAVPPIAIGAGALTVALSNRSLQVELLGGAGSFGDPSSSWVNRIGNLVLFAVALGKISEVVFRPGWRARPATMTLEQQAHRRLFVVFLAYCFGSLVLPMVLSANPAFSHDGFVAVPMFVAIYLSRKESMDGVMTSAKWALVAVVAAGLVAAALLPKVAVEAHYMSGWIPGLTSRLWGLTPHANHMGALAVYVMLFQSLRPSLSRLLNMAVWLAAFAALLLSQSKTSWFACLLVVGVVAVYRNGRDKQGKLKIEVCIAACLGLAAIVSSLLFVNVDRIVDRVLDSDVGSGITNFTGRTKIWAAATRMWLESPVFGYGPEAWFPKHRMEIGLPTATQAHNQLLDALSTGGLAYAVPLVIYFCLLAAGSVRAASRTKGISLGLFAVFAVRCVSESPLGIGNLVGGDLAIQLLLFMMITNEHVPNSDAVGDEHLYRRSIKRRPSVATLRDHEYV